MIKEMLESITDRKSAKKDFYTAVKERRSIYGISKGVSIADNKIKDLVNDSVKYCPTAFNSQSGRVIVVLNEKHNRLWDMTKEALKKVVPPEQFSSTEQKINSFRTGYGTVLFFEDQSVIEGLQKQYELYKDNFPVWSQQSSGMLQYIIWTALENEGLGASLQHYNELIEGDIKNEWDVPDNWKLIAQMPFGEPTMEPSPKEYQPLEHRVKFYK